MRKFKPGYYEIKPDKNRKPTVYGRKSKFTYFLEKIWYYIKILCKGILKLIAILVVGYFFTKFADLFTLR